MSSKRSQILLIITILLSFSLACVFTGESADTTASDDDAIAAAVAETLAAEEAEASVADAEPEPETQPEPDILYQGTSFSFDPSLTENVNAENVAAQGSENEYFGIPDHLQFTFNNYTVADAYHTPVIKIYSVEAFKSINPTAGESLDKLKAAVDSQDVHSGDIRVVDFFGAEQFFESLVSVVNFQNGSGFRYISQYGQAAWPIGFPHMFYTFQGFTADGEYYISAVFPISHPSLPQEDNVVMDDAFYDNFVNYSADTQMHLDQQDAESFDPSLLLLDAVVESLLVEP